MGLTALGLAGLLGSLPPMAGTAAVPPAGSTLAVAAACAAAMPAAVACRAPTAAPGSGAGRVLALAVATGLGYGITAVALKTVGTQLPPASPAAPAPRALRRLALGPPAIRSARPPCSRAAWRPRWCR